MADTSAPIAALVRVADAPAELPQTVEFGEKSPAILVGRVETCQVVLKDKKISKIHCRLTLRTCKRKGTADGEVMKRLFIKDSSSFGTFVNGKSLQKEQWIMLQEGDIVGLRNPHGNPAGGEYRVQYQDGGAAGTQVAQDDEAAANSQQPRDPRQRSAEVAVAQQQQQQQMPEACSPVSDAGDAATPSKPARTGAPGPASAPRGSGKKGEENLSPLSEISEVSKPDDAGLPPHQAAMAALLPGISTVARPMGPQSMMPGMPGVPFNPMQMMGGPRPGFMVPMGVPPPGGSPGAPPPPAAPAPIVMTIQPEMVGLLIGRGGETVNQLSRESGARIVISKTGGEANPGERTIYIHGAQECIDRAKAKIEECLAKAKEKLGSSTTSSNQNGCVMKVAHELVGMLIGKGGETIKDLKRESGARIDISKEPTDGDTTNRLVHISGPPECVEYAKKMIEEMLGRSRERLAGEHTGEGLSDTSLPTRTTIQVRHELVGMLIGKGGETISALQKESGVRIEIARDDEAERQEKRNVHLCGPADRITRAKQLIEEALGRSREMRSEGRLRDRSRSRSASRSASRSKDRGRRRARSPSPRGPKVIKVAPELVGMLIGRGGETVMAIQRDTGARIEISKDDREDRERTVTISGSPAAIERAKEQIDDLIHRARDRLGPRSERRRGGEGHDMLALPGPGDAGEDAGQAMLEQWRQSPIRETYVSEKVYIDECEMPFRPAMFPEHEDGLPTDLELFIRGLPKACMEQQLWEHMYRLGATDVKEILLLRRQGQSKGMAYVVFNRHDHAVLAKNRLHNVPASTLPCGGQPQAAEEKANISARFSESERCINGRANVYGCDMVRMLLGSKGKSMSEVKDGSRLRKVLLTGRNLKAFGQVDEDPRLHMVVHYEPDEVDNVKKALDIWGGMLGKVHREVAEHITATMAMKGKGKGWPEWGMDPFGRPPMFFPRPPFPDGMMPPMGIPPPPDFAMHMDSPVLVRRQTLPVAIGNEAAAPAGPKVIEATRLRGRELRWQPWPDTSKFNEEYSTRPLCWGLRGELFVLLRKRETGEARVCLAETHLLLERWPVFNAAPTPYRPLSKTARYRSFTFNEHLFIVSVDRELGDLKVYHVPDPSSAWNIAFETTLPEEYDPTCGDGFHMSRKAKLTFFYMRDKIPHVVVVEPSAPAEAATHIFRIADPGKAWARLAFTPPISGRSRVLPLYTKPVSATGPPNGPATDFEVCICAVDPASNELSVFHVPGEADKPWTLVSSTPFTGDTHFSCIYVPGKPEPLLMAGSPTDRKQKLCHLNVQQWLEAHQKGTAPPSVPIVEEKFSRPMSSLWHEVPSGADPQSIVALPIDCTVDLPVSKHAWVSTPMGQGPAGDSAPGAMPPGPMPYGGACRPPYDIRPPPFGRPPFDMPMGGPPMGRPPFDAPPMGPMPMGAPPMGAPPPPGMPPMGVMPPMGGPMPPPPMGRPPFDAPPVSGPPPAGPPPLGGPPMGGPPQERPPGQVGDAPPRAPFDAPPGGWVGGAPGMPPPIPPGGPPPPTGPPPGATPALTDGVSDRDRAPSQPGPPPLGTAPGAPPLGPPPGAVPGMPPLGVPPGVPPPPGMPPPGMPPPGAAPPGAAAPGAPPPALEPGSMEVGAIVEANFRDRNWWSKAKVIARHADGTFDVEYEGTDFIEWHVPPVRVRPLGQPGSTAAGGAERERRHRRHRHRGEGGAEGEGGDKERRRRRREEKGDKESGAARSKSRDKSGEPEKRRRRHRSKDRDDKKDRSRSRDPDKDGERKHRRRRHKSSERKQEGGAGAKLDDANAEEAKGGKDAEADAAA